MSDTHEHPSSGGSYAVDKHGKRTLIDPPTKPNPGKSARASAAQTPADPVTDKPQRAASKE